MRPILSRTLAVALSAAVVTATIAVGRPDITRAGLERALAPAFANLYVQQAAILGVPGVTTATIGAAATCDRGGPAVADVGAGPDWICMMGWTEGTGTRQDGKFEVTVRTDASYAAGGPSKLIGLATITDTHGHDVPNPVFAFDGVIATGS